jgi:TatD DNase family protein
MQLDLIDIGVNLGHASFTADREQVIERAKVAGVTIMVITGTSLKGSSEAQQIASNYPGILYSTAGIHPHNARQCNEGTLRTLYELVQKKEVVAIGECGLDYNRDFSPRPVQDKWFEAQIALACEVKLPLFLHERDAHQRFVDILKSYRDQFDKAVVHCFTGTGEELQRFLDMGLYIGITGWICDERRGSHLRELVRHIPLDKLMIETDAPFLTPKNLQPKPQNGRNEPSFLLHVLRTVAQCIGKTEEEVAQATTTTARKFFNLELTPNRMK